MIPRYGSRIIKLLPLLFFLLLLTFGGIQAPLFDEDEGFYAEAARVMLEDGNWFEISVNGEIRSDKPPFVVWLIALSFKIFGFHPWAARVPSLLCTLGILFILWKWSKKRHEPIYLFGGTLLTWIISKAAIADAALNLSIIGSLYFLWSYANSQSRQYFYLAVILSAFGFLTKGPIAILIPGFVWLIFWLVQKPSVWLVRPLGILLWFLLISPWFIGVYLETGGNFKVFADHVLIHNIGRFQNPMERHQGPWFYFILIFLVATLPLLSFYISIFRQLWEDKSKPLAFLQWTWFGFVMVFFSFSQTKLPHYIVPALLPLMINPPTFQKLPSWPTWIWLLTCSLLPFVAYQIKDDLNDPYIEVLFSHIFDEFSWPYYLILMALAIVLVRSHFLRSNNLIISAFIGIILYTLLFWHWSQLQQQPLQRLSKKLPIDQVIYVKHHYFPSFSFYRKKISPIRNPSPNDWILGKYADVKEYDLQPKYEDHGIYLGKVKQIKRAPIR